MSAGPNAETILTSDELEPTETPLCAQSLQTRVEREDVLPSLILDDGEQVVEISTAIGPRAEAVDRLTRLAATALALAEELRAA